MKKIDEGNTFNIYLRTSNSDTVREFEAVKNGFSWPAFFFGALWALNRGMVRVGFNIIFLFLLLNAIGVVIILVISSSSLIKLISIVVAFFYILSTILIFIWVGESGNKWVASSLENKGYELVQVNVPAYFPSEAIQLYKKEHNEEDITPPETKELYDELNREPSTNQVSETDVKTLYGSWGTLLRNSMTGGIITAVVHINFSERTTIIVFILCVSIAILGKQLNFHWLQKISGILLMPYFILLSVVIWQYFMPSATT